MAGVPRVQRRNRQRTLLSSIDWWRVAALSIATSAHLVGAGLLALPDYAPRNPERSALPLADITDSDRLALYVDLVSMPAPPLPPMPAPLQLLASAPAIEPTPAPEPALQTAATSAASVPTPDPVPDEGMTAAIATASKAAAPVVSAPAAAPAARRPSGDPKQVRNDRTAYMRALMAALLQHRSYPPEARKQRARGTVHVRFSVGRDGHVLASNIARGAGFEVLDTAALEVLRSADPLPPIPDSLGVDRLTVTVPIEYSLITR
jgi:protein TonB